MKGLPAYFLSKFEMTRGQWMLANGIDASRPGLTGAGASARFPMDMISALQCGRALERLGLVLRNDVQWERAARAGTTTPWWTGSDAGSLQGKENILDQSSAAKSKEWGLGMRMTPAEWDDGEPGYGPVGLRGKREPNPFGLWDMLGNVSEWCSNAAYVLGHELPPASAAQRSRMARGGSARNDPFFARASVRAFNNNPDFIIPALGCRPARALDP